VLQLHAGKQEGINQKGEKSKSVTPAREWLREGEEKGRSKETREGEKTQGE